ncbi:MAG: hypothetical protein KA956_02335 [Pyrinomonadaceae bacterium]|nr:hypothetical protein [Acidobacteriota bacterium]MBP7375295.1 hypothetical protein [Pyrinomonadaceae bacterium]
MSTFDSPLNNVRIASPCSADWDEMYGDNRKRFCGDCKLNVYNLSGMTKEDAEALVTNAEGRLCVRYFQRSDGTVLTADCPVGWAKMKQRTKAYATAVASLLIALFSGVLFVSLFSKGRPAIGKLLIPFTEPTPDRPTMGVMRPMASPSPSPATKKKMPKVDHETMQLIGKTKPNAGFRD